MTIPAYAERLDSLTRVQVERLELYAMLVEHTGRGVTRLSRDIYRGTIDSRRFFRGALRQAIIERDTDDDGAVRCAYCDGEISGEDGDWVYIDHVVPHTLGGQTVIDNGVCACSTCNSSKSDRVW